MPACHIIFEYTDKRIIQSIKRNNIEHNSLQFTKCYRRIADELFNIKAQDDCEYE